MPDLDSPELSMAERFEEEGGDEEGGGGDESEGFSRGAEAEAAAAAAQVASGEKLVRVGAIVVFGVRVGGWEGICRGK